MSLCPSSSHQLVAAAIAFRRARRKFPKDFGLASTVVRASINTKALEAATSREESINQEKSSFALVRRACNSRSDHVCSASSARSHDYDRCSEENSIRCSCCRTRNVGNDNLELRNECSSGDVVDIVPSKEYEDFLPSNVDYKNKFMKPGDRDRCNISRSTDDDESVRTVERIAYPISCRHCETRCPCSYVDPVNNPSCDSIPREKHDKVACGDFTGDVGEQLASASCHGTFIDLDGSAKENVVTSDSRDRGPDIRDARTRSSTLTTRRKIVDSTWRCECHPGEDSISNLSRSPCDCWRDGHCHRRDYRPDHFRRRCCYRHSPSAKGCEARESDVSGEKARHKSWRDQMRGKDGRLCARQCYSKEYSGIIPASRERNVVECRRRSDDDGEDEDDDSGVAVINHKDSMCILAEKYKAGGKWRGGRCRDAERSGDRDKDECNKSLSLEIIDQPKSPLEIVNVVPHEGPSVKHVCQPVHCENCGTTAIAKTCGGECGRRGLPEGELGRLKFSLNETTTTRSSSSQAPCRHTF
ncbi:hypothetical protein PUN28_013263 [Cardiocondyla obscurior]|uniref:Uncharacterized protein n=1 Tax=Cardiocondyla obscurior TaxID=286306 RepID=A0AAW2FD92_9HYME